MNYRVFVSRMVEDLAEQFTTARPEMEVTEVFTESTLKDPYLGIQVMTLSEDPKERRSGVCLNLEPYYQWMQKEGIYWDHVLERIQKDLTEALEEKESMDFSEILDLEKMLPRTMLCLMGYEANKERLRNLVYQRVEDLALVLRAKVTLAENQPGYVTMTKAYARELNISEKEMFQKVMASAPLKYPPTLKELSQMIEDLSGVKVQGPEDGGLKAYMLTCHMGSYGAGCLFYPGYMEKLAEQLQGSYYILPSSVHELILIPEKDGFEASKMQEMVRDINHHVLPKEDILTDSVYHYDRETGIFRKI